MASLRKASCAASAARSASPSNRVRYRCSASWCASNTASKSIFKTRPATLTRSGAAIQVKTRLVPDRRKDFRESCDGRSSRPPSVAHGTDETGQMEKRNSRGGDSGGLISVAQALQFATSIRPPSLRSALRVRVFRGFRGHSLRARRVSRWPPTFAIAGPSS